MFVLSSCLSFPEFTTKPVITHIFYQMVPMKFTVFQCLFLDEMLYEAHSRGSFGFIGVIKLFQT